MPPAYLQQTPRGLAVELLISPRASRTAVVGEHDGRLKIQIKAPPVDGEANKALVRFVSRALGVHRDAVVIDSGETGRRKRLLIEGVSAQDFLAAFELG